MLTLQVRCFNGKKISVVPKKGVHTSVYEIQNEVEKSAGIPVTNQMLMYRGQVLDNPQQTLSAYGIDEALTEVTMSVVRNVRPGITADSATASSSSSSSSRATKSTAAGASSDSRNSRTATSGTASAASAGTGGAGAGSGSRAGLADVESLARQLRNLGTGSSGRGSRSSGANPAMADPNALLQSLLAGNSGAAGGDQADTMNWLQQMTQLMGGLWESPAMQEYLSSAEKQEESRQALLNNPFLRQWMDADPQFREVVEDPQKWAESMRAARELFAQQGGLSAATEAAGQTSGAARAASALHAAAGSDRRHHDGVHQTSSRLMVDTGDDERADDAEAENPAKESARLRDERTRELARAQGLNLNELSIGYGFALGQALLNSGFGLDHELVIRGFRDALAGKEFPVNIAKYERQMGILQGIANDVVGEINLQEAEAFFETAKTMPELFNVLEPDRIVWEEVDDAEPSATAGGSHKKCESDDVNVMMVLQGRLLDGRFFFTCPSDENGEMVNPITMRVGDAPPALRKIVLDMHEGEARTVYVHPESCENMSEMFGQMLPKNALLIFDIELVQVDVPMEEE
jgi:FKBP-type peptidyl-prolyl cis-trans isomerase